MLFPKGIRRGELPRDVAADIAEQLHGYIVAGIPMGVDILSRQVKWKSICMKPPAL